MSHPYGGLESSAKESKYRNVQQTENDDRRRTLKSAEHGLLPGFVTDEVIGLGFVLMLWISDFCSTLHTWQSKQVESYQSF